MNDNTAALLGIYTTVEVRPVFKAWNAHDNCWDVESRFMQELGEAPYTDPDKWGVYLIQHPDGNGICVADWHDDFSSARDAYDNALTYAQAGLAFPDQALVEQHLG